MKKYIVEGGINFYDELYNSLYFDDKPDSENDNFENICQITGLKLTDKHVKLECGHSFNYEPLYKEIYRQKFIFHSYSLDSLSKKDQSNIKELNKDYFIKCPYCRNIQFTLLPYYDDLNLDKRYGINSLEKTEKDVHFLLKLNTDASSSMPSGYYRYGYHFKPGPCCKEIYNIDDKIIYCKSIYSANLPNSDKTYCHYHIKNEIIEYKIQKKLKLIEEKKKLMEAKNKMKEEKLKLMEAKNKMKEEKKKLTQEKNTSNILQQCNVILKTGKNKGNPCGNIVHDNNNNMCCRHVKMYNTAENKLNEK